MTSREAIDVLKVLKDVLEFKDFAEAEALQIAIDALIHKDAETVMPDPDTVSRKAVISAINNLHDKPNAWLDNAVEAVKELPPSPSRPHGQWIPCTKEGLLLSELAYTEGQKWYGYKCSECNFIYKGNALTESPYCQNCGADMRQNGGAV